MASAFAAQLRQIAVTSTNELDLKSQKAEHSQSFIFEKRVAGSQDFETIYQLCSEGFQELCQLDQRFFDFQRNIFNAQSKAQDRLRMTSQENEALDNVIEHFLSLVASKILLRPAVKALEWLIRRFRVHVFNTSYLISTFLPYHETPIFQNLLSILPPELPVQYRFLTPYLTNATNPPRSVIAHNATSSDPFFAVFCSHTLETCRREASYPLLLTFWTSIVTEAVSGRIAAAQSGRKELQQQRQHDVLLKVIPLLSEGLSIKSTPELTLACYTIIVVLANKGNLADEAIDSLMEAVAIGLTSRDLYSGLVCLCILAEQKTTQVASRKLLKLLLKRSDFAEGLSSVDQSYSASGLAEALARRGIQDLKRKNYANRLQFVSALIGDVQWRPEHAIHFLRDLLKTLTNTADNDGLGSAIKAQLLEILRRLCQVESVTQKLHESANELDLNKTKLESLLEQVIGNSTDSVIRISEDGAMDSDIISEPEDPLAKGLEHLPERTVHEYSFLTSIDSPLFQQLSVAYQAICRYTDGAARFQALPLWNTSNQNQSVLFVSFMLRIACGSYPEHCRHAALRAIALQIDGEDQGFDSQALLCYMVSRLADPATTVRRSASEVLIAMQRKGPRDSSNEGESRRWGADDLYDHEKMGMIKWLPPSDLKQVLKQGILPSLEECVADASYINQVLEKILSGNQHLTNGGYQRSPPNVKELRKSIRHGLFESLISHIIATPLWMVKVDFIKLLSGVDKIGSITKFKALQAIVQQWATLSIDDAIAVTAKEGLAVSHVDSGIVNLVNPSDKDAANLLLKLVTDNEVPPRSSFINSVFDRLTATWQRMRPDAKSAGAQKLIDISLSASTFSGKTREVLSTLELPAEALIRVLHAAFAIVPAFKDSTPSRKRRRSSSGTKPSASALKNMVSHMTLALELIDSSKPEHHPELLTGLFEALSVLQNLKVQSQQDFPYLLNLCLRSMLAIVGKFVASAKTKKDFAAARTELVTDCVRHSSSPQVQNTAILLSAELARVVPEKILHNAMPIFTFLGTNAAVKDDEHSEYVVNRAIDEIIPPLMRTLQSERKDVIGAVSDLLSSFSAAFEHIARHRRLSLFRRLLAKLGTDGTLNTFVAMLLVRNPKNDDAGIFVTNLLESFPIEVQLRTVLDLLEQALQVSQSNNDVTKLITASEVVDGKTDEETLRIMLVGADRIIKASNFENGLRSPFKDDKKENKIFDSQILEISKLLMQLARNTSEDDMLSSTVDRCMESLLDRLAFTSFAGLTAHLLESEDASWHQDTILMLERRLSGPATKDSRSHKAAVEMLQTLTGLINENEHDRVKHGAIRCIDRIIELYGRRHVAAVLEAANVLLSSQAINPEKPALQTTVLLCLASMVDCAQEAIIPAVPKLMSVSITILKESLTEDAEDDRLHDAAYALVSAVISNVPFMLSEDDLDNVLKLSAEAANAGIGQHNHSARQNALDLLAQTVDIKYIIPSIRRTWSTAVENDVDAVSQVLDVLSKCIKQGSKKSIMDLASQISSLFTQMFDLRRVQFMQRDEDSYSDDEVALVEATVNKVAIEFVYKLNDMKFRPLLSEWVDWATKCAGISSAQFSLAKLHRQTSLFSFMTHLFATLKSIVTSYATFVLESAVEVFQSSEDLLGAASASLNILNADQKMLWVTTCNMIAEASRHDQDSFFASPSRFPSLSLSLVAQLKMAADKMLQKEIQDHFVPAIVALASATADTVSHHKDLNHHICQLRHAEAVGVRMSSIQTQHALIASEEVGEEWVNNVVQGGGEILVYINEMLEDDDEDVEREVRKWVRKVREMVGEDLFEA